MAGKDNVADASSSFMDTVMEYAKNPTYIMMFLAGVFLLTIAFMMYKKPEMLQKLMNPNGSQKNQTNVNDMNDDEQMDIGQGADL
tara:strand:+ start:7958 stop:8212 length:255 start_codon:yes stop_codon:yes gene_type:complete